MPSLLRIVLGLVVVAISLATAQIKMNVVTPDPALVIFGRPLPILWDGGRRPFELSIVKADNLSHTLSSLHGLHWSWSTTWMVDLPPGTSISVRVEDLEGRTAYSAPLLVLSKEWAQGTTSDAFADPSSVSSAAAVSATSSTLPTGDGSLSPGNIGGIVGGILAGVALVLLALTVFLLQHRRQSRCFGLRPKLADEAEAKDVPLATIKPFAAGPTPLASPSSSVASLDLRQAHPLASV